MTHEKQEELGRRLRELGFDEVRFARLDAGPDGRAGLAAWLHAGHHADMAWLAASAPRRMDPEQVLPGARSIILLGVNHLPAGPGAAQQRWARYSLYGDYHDTIGAALRAAGGVLETHAGLTREDYRAYVDTGPVMDRGWAARAGLGWQGKNGMLISRTHGNWLFLAAILTRLECPDETAATEGAPWRGRRSGAGGTARAAPAAAPAGVAPGDARSEGGFCGTCTRCLAACPTQAFPRPGWVDARRCISYHTIENRGIIPRDLRRAFGPRVFGCDTCLEVCPWNRFAQAGRSVLLQARFDLVELSLVDLLGMDETRFRATFRRSPIKRPKLPGLLRNACIAAGNWDDSADWHFGSGAERALVVAAVERLSLHPSEVVRAHAVWALYRLCGPGEAAARLASLRARETSAVVEAEIEAGGAGAGADGPGASR